MFVIVTYDVNEKRVNKVRKILKKYFTWVQNSVFEGEITLGKLEKCKRELLSVIEKNEDSVYFYEMEYKLVCNKKVLGQEKNYDSIII
ncbi:CRISPR-associated endonuclease Cas2 [Caldicellulosiruptor bescii]|uniref:CRISPR-associated endoribonuclease Cas2 n=1 Tax=Caldicellulosiruptor bescii (strain ATCC BAA-1888 / DSM 6725 / KCTC 15123 / Z-1320) TaxID=521460 RepID=B9MLS8_CALBD|nr:CRISPR-associated endonuclease Cas2 [Caldicellulosiruptor bescii]ACM59286.1 CRISPR-associated protein Cas2 [Caldicellulosiruptor bescii DSM 6725]PFH16046.1 CRISPR-associated Cas2 family protein [Caldicellulosiruptor bescii]SKC39322.1 CRISPR-associated protein, Cas2 family [Caldicellulosiruptor bescii]